MDTISLELAVFDWIALAVVVLGLVFGLMRGLGSAFAALLWVVAALWLGSTLAPTVLGWMPNTADLDDGGALTSTWGTIAAVIVFLPLIGKLVGGSLGRKADDHLSHNRYMGGLVGLLLAVLVTTAAAVFVPRVGVTASGYSEAFAPEVARTVADQARFLYPEFVRDELRRQIDGIPRVERALDDAGAALEEAADGAAEVVDEVLAGDEAASDG